MIDARECRLHISITIVPSFHLPAFLGRQAQNDNNPFLQNQILRCAKDWGLALGISNIERFR